jgi:hypothetical protein
MTASTDAMRAKHDAALRQVKTTVPIGPKRIEMLRRLDAVAVKIRAKETAVKSK